MPHDHLQRTPNVSNMSGAPLTKVLSNGESGLPESRVLIIGTGGTICMQDGPDGLQPSGDFLKAAMAPHPAFNDMSNPPGKLSSFYLFCLTTNL